MRRATARPRCHLKDRRVRILGAPPRRAMRQASPQRRRHRDSTRSSERAPTRAQAFANCGRTGPQRLRRVARTHARPGMSARGPARGPEGQQSDRVMGREPKHRWPRRQRPATDRPTPRAATCRRPCAKSRQRGGPFSTPHGIHQSPAAAHVAPWRAPWPHKFRHV